MAAFQRLGQERRGDADVARRAPTEAHPFPQQARQLVDVSVRIVIAAASAHHQEQCIAAVDGLCRSLGFSVGFDPGGADIMKVVLELE